MLDETEAPAAAAAPVVDPPVAETGAPESVAAVEAAPAVPFAVDQTHPLDSMPIGSTATKVPNATMVVDTPDTQTVQHPLGTADVLHHVPEGSTLTVLKGVGASTMIALTLPENDHRKGITLVGMSVHHVVSAAWTWILDETKDGLAALRKAL